MKFVRFNDDKLGLLTDDGIVDLTDQFQLKSNDPLKEFVRSDSNVHTDALPEAQYDPAEASNCELNAPSVLKQNTKLILDNVAAG